MFHYILPRSRGNYSLSIVSDESVIFLHRLNPLGMLESLGESVGFSDSLDYGGEAIFWVGFDDDIFRVGLHGMMV